MNSRRASDISSATAHIESFMTYREFAGIHIDDFKHYLKSLYPIAVIFSSKMYNSTNQNIYFLAKNIVV